MQDLFPVGDEAVAAQQLEHITPYCADLRTFREGEGQFDLCACNPPYFIAVLLCGPAMK